MLDQRITLTILYKAISLEWRSTVYLLTPPPKKTNKKPTQTPAKKLEKHTKRLQ